MNLSRVQLATGAAIVLALLIFAAVILRADQGNKPLCHKQTWAEAESWLFSHVSGELPNIEGDSAKSLTELDQEGTAGEWNAKYQYLPGLRSGDLGELVLMYMKRPTRWKNHAAMPPSFFSEAKWMIVPLDFVHTLSPKYVTWVKREILDEGECSERVSLEEFKTRLRKTLKYLQDNNRPQWQKVVAENEEFLKTLAGE